jgi:two-component system response regulator PilR (NtrC family)
VGDLPLPMQVKLLRAIQEKKFRRLGDTVETAVDVRILSATHQNLKAMVEAARFRQDLFYRLNVIELRMPALRERSEDIPPGRDPARAAGRVVRPAGGAPQRGCGEGADGLFSRATCASWRTSSSGRWPVQRRADRGRRPAARPADIGESSPPRPTPGGPTCRITSTRWSATPSRSPRESGGNRTAAARAWASPSAPCATAWSGWA